MQTNNLNIWKQIEDTDYSATKQGDFQGRVITSINGTSVVKKLTELWGPLGSTWGYKILEERYDQGAPIIKKLDSGEIRDYGFEIVHTVKIEFWYTHDNKICTFPHYGHTFFVQNVSYGAKTDHEAPKKSLTDALKKCASMLGSNADIFLGYWDDIGYQEGAKIKESISKADNVDEKLVEEVKKFEDALEGQIEIFKSARSLATLKTMAEAAKNKFTRSAVAIGKDPAAVTKYIAEKYREIGGEFEVEITCSECGSVEVRKRNSECQGCKEVKNKKPARKATGRTSAKPRTKTQTKKPATKTQSKSKR